MKLITEENIPCLYELSWDAKKLAIILRIHKDIKDFIERKGITFNDLSPIAISLKEEFGFNSFKGDLSGNIGFDDAFMFSKEENDFIEFLIKIPPVRIVTEEKCDECKGSGKKEEWDNDCLYCQGTGHEIKYDWQRGFAVSASFTAVLTLLSLYLYNKEAPVSFPQLLTLQTRTNKGMHGGSLGGEFSKTLRKWLDTLGFVSIPEMIQAMKDAYNQMIPLREYDHLEFRAYTNNENGLIYLDCPGDATGLNPERICVDKNRGYEFGCHNVDSPAQQITLIAGLAALCDKAKKEIGFG